MSLVKSTAIIGFYTLLSRIFGFVRDVLVANAIGASWLSDAFFVAFKLPNFFRRLFGEGAFNAAFVPQFAGLLSTEGREAAMRFASESMAVLLLCLMILNGIFLVFMPWIMPIFAPGFTDDPDKYDLTVTLARIAFPYILFISLVSLLGGILNSIGRFAAVAAAPILLNITLIAALWWLVDYTETTAHALSIGVFIAGLVQLFWVGYACWKADSLPALLAPRFTPHVKKLFKLIAPAALGAGVAQVNLLIDVILASNFEDGVSYLYYADRLNEFPIGVIGVAVGTALLPMLSKQIRAGEMGKAHYTLNRAIELVWLFGLPSAVALLVIPGPITSVLYEHGAFTAEDSRATAAAMAAFAAGLPAFVLVKVLAPGFYANEDTKTPFTIAAICVAVNLCFNLILMQHYTFVGLAMSTSIAGWVNAILMGVILYRRELLIPDQALRQRAWRMAFCAVVMGGVLYGLSLPLTGWLAGVQWQKILALLLLVGGGMLVYGVLCLLLKAADLEQIGRVLRRRPKAG